MPPAGTRRVIVEADGNGQVSLACFGIKNTQLMAEERENGSISLLPTTGMSPAEVEHYRDPEAVARLEKAFAEAREGKLRRFTRQDLRSYRNKGSNQPDGGR